MILVALGLCISTEIVLEQPAKHCNGTETNPCLEHIQCKHQTTGQTVVYKRVFPALDTNDVDDARYICSKLGLALPSIHDELQNYCIQKAGEFGEKSQITLGLEYDTDSKKWVWDDKSALSYNKVWPTKWSLDELPVTQQSKRWCARLVSFFKKNLNNA